MKKEIIFLLIMTAVLFIGCEQRIGGDTDKHGCLVAAGYQWCESEQRCLRAWEDYCEDLKEQFRITNFETCVKAGNPVMESYPRQCTADGETFTEEILCTADVGTCPDGSYVSRVPPTCEFEPCPDDAMPREEAIRHASGTECTEKGALTENYDYNPNSETWWIDLDMKEEYAKELCSPACVIDKEGNAEINWRCTGLIQ
jgi:hypothetical protein